MTRPSEPLPLPLPCPRRPESAQRECRHGSDASGQHRSSSQLHIDFKPFSREIALAVPRRTIGPFEQRFRFGVTQDRLPLRVPPELAPSLRERLARWHAVATRCPLSRSEIGSLRERTQSRNPAHGDGTGRTHRRCGPRRLRSGSLRRRYSRSPRVRRRDGHCQTAARHFPA